YVTTTVRVKSNLRTVRRPSWIPILEGIIGHGVGIASVGVHYPNIRLNIQWVVPIFDHESYLALRRC
ncbi:MAG: hypothetical protein ACP5PX_08230, partial [Candidatus Hadarchaeum sp.]|uniref:hypothetical protein n=1 Tax=Candidatus Hadarchaeum sp. TaxID=2883567 RepID=UPI003D096F4F